MDRKIITERIPHTGGGIVLWLVLYGDRRFRHACCGFRIQSCEKDTCPGNGGFIVMLSSGEDGSLSLFSLRLVGDLFPDLTISG